MTLNMFRHTDDDARPPSDAENQIGKGSPRPRTLNGRISRNASQRPLPTRERSAYDKLATEDLDRLQGEMVISCLWQEQQKMQYTSSPLAPNEGVVVRTPQLNNYICHPQSLQDEEQPLWLIARQLNLRVCPDLVSLDLSRRFKSADDVR